MLSWDSPVIKSLGDPRLTHSGVVMFTALHTWSTWMVRSECWPHPFVGVVMVFAYIFLSTVTVLYPAFVASRRVRRVPSENQRDTETAHPTTPTEKKPSGLSAVRIREIQLAMGFPLWMILTGIMWSYMTLEVSTWSRDPACSLGWMGILSSLVAYRLHPWPALFQTQ